MPRTAAQSKAGSPAARTTAGSPARPFRWPPGQAATTDAAGGFRITDLRPGDYSLSFQAAGFFKSESKVHLDSASAADRVDIDLTPHSSISGRVLDQDDKPVAGVHVEITQSIRGSGTTWQIWGADTDKAGSYLVDVLRPGTYLVRTLPRRRAWAATYYPSTSDRRQAAELVLTGGTQIAGCDVHLLTPAGYAIRGTVYDDRGKPVTATVRLVSSVGLLTQTEARVEASDGVFEIPDVPSGDWRLLAETERAGVKLLGAQPAVLDRHDLSNIAIHLQAPFAWRALVEPQEKGIPVHIELYPVDAPPDAAYANSQSDSNGVVQFPAVYPGRYRINTYGEVPGHYLDSILIGDQDALGKEVMLTEGMPPLRVIFKADSAGLRGTVEKCGGATVLVLPRDEDLWNFRFIRRASCDATGHFQIGGLRPGGYYVIALDRIDSTGLDRLSTLRAVAAMAARVDIDSGRVAYIELKRLPWPE